MGLQWCVFGTNPALAKVEISTYRKVYSDKSIEEGHLYGSKKITYSRKYPDHSVELGVSQDGVVRYGRAFRDDERDHYFGQRKKGFDEYLFITPEGQPYSYLDKRPRFSYEMEYLSGPYFGISERADVRFVEDTDPNGEVILSERVEYVRTSRDSNEKGVRFKGETVYRIEYSNFIEKGFLIKGGLRSHTKVPLYQEDRAYPTWRERLWESQDTLYFQIDENGGSVSGYQRKDGKEEEIYYLQPNGDQDIVTLKNGIKTQDRISATLIRTEERNDTDPIEVYQPQLEEVRVTFTNDLYSRLRSELNKQSQLN